MTKRTRSTNPPKPQAPWTIVREIAAQIEIIAGKHWGCLSPAMVGRCFDEALSHGAFAGSKYLPLRALTDATREKIGNARYGAVFVAAVHWLRRNGARSTTVDWQKAFTENDGCLMLADALRVEADAMEEAEHDEPETLLPLKNGQGEGKSPAPKAIANRIEQFIGDCNRFFDLQPGLRLDDQYCLLASEGEELASILESLNENSLELLRFCGALREGIWSVSEARKVWANLRLVLKRIALHLSHGKDDDAGERAGQEGKPVVPLLPDGQSRQTKSVRPKIELAEDRLQIRIGEDWYELTEKQSGLLAVLLKANGAWVGGKNCGAEPHKTRKAMPAKVQKIINTDRSKGYRICPELL
jgi:hypothetical protein